MYHFCTYFDQHYLPKALALYRSLQIHCPDFKLWVLCMDQGAYDFLAQFRLPEVHLIALEDFEQNDELLVSAKQNRSKIEYYFTCTPSLPLYVLRKWQEVEMITYIDADLYLFSNPQPLYDEMQHGSVGIIGHRFPPQLQELEIYGLYNVGWLMFRRDDNALACLQWWRERCIEWCYDRLDGDRFADQKYLDQWETRFKGVVVLKHKGANLAPWNVARYQLHILEDQKTVYVDEQPLIFFHFHGLKRVKSWLYEPGWKLYNLTPTKLLRTKIYAPYISMLLEVQRTWLAAVPDTNIPGGIRRRAHDMSGKSPFVRIISHLRAEAIIGLRFLLGRYLLAIQRP